ncbi:hypothetical protein [Nonomuraea salmonea]|uniref:DinB/UmuC family translesion DNA polymerase n=1 Tax=Nonomuraea salmonea TaxID=46181 RepID=UPI003CD088D7
MARGHSRETTFTHDLTDPGTVTAHLTTLATQVAHDAREAGREITRVTVKIRTTPFQTRTRQTTLTTPHHRPRHHHRSRPHDPRPPRPHPPRTPHRRRRGIRTHHLRGTRAGPHSRPPDTTPHPTRVTRA